MSSALPAAENVENWNTDHVIQWGQRVSGLDEDAPALVRKEKYSGISLHCAIRDSLKSDGFAGGSADAFLFARCDKLHATNFFQWLGKMVSFELLFPYSCI